MPELPEVETGRKLIHEKCLGLRILKAKFLDDSIVFPDVASKDLEKSLEGKVLKDTGRFGKYFYLVFNLGPCLVGHLGMTGNLEFSDGSSIFLVKSNSGAEKSWPPRFTKFELSFGDDKGELLKLALTDPRRLSRFKLIDKPLSSEPISKLGFDPIINPPSLSEFIEMVRCRRTPIKALLLNQAFSAGVGNWIADEVLYQSRVHPEQHSNSLSDEQIARILSNMKEICRIAISFKADYRQFPKTWIFGYRWNKGKKSAENLIDGRKIVYLTVGGRTSAVVPEVQKIEKSVAKVSPAKKTTVTVAKKAVKAKVLSKEKILPTQPDISIRRSLRIIARNLK
ncbi:hypothetical protein DSO57_1033420 [Entomophthora muscae]|uniref:Uncharacterized protein n=1 Tax=Entomophthora muscae TaxID=34485 RepID=A0ACC2TYE2_9FUNG|nr:hypothetical protein DSO57_1033420 [Entomophthora muscae]